MRTEALVRQAVGATDSERHEIRQRIIELNLPLADTLAHRFVGRGVETDDLEQVAATGLCLATWRYRGGPGSVFAAFATPTILGELRRHFRDHGWAVRPSRGDQELALRMHAMEEELTQLLGRHPTRAELADRLDCPVDALERASRSWRAYRHRSLDAPATGDQPPMAETVADRGDGFAAVDDALALRDLVEHLAPRERLIVRLRFVDRLTQAEIGLVVGVSQMQVSRLLAASLERLRAVLKAEARAA